MARHTITLIPGDGIGPEVMTEVKKLIAWMNSHGMGTFATEEGLCGGCAYDASCHAKKERPSQHCTRHRGSVRPHAHEAGDSQIELPSSK